MGLASLLDRVQVGIGLLVQVFFDAGTTSFHDPVVSSGKFNGGGKCRIQTN